MLSYVFIESLNLIVFMTTSFIVGFLIFFVHTFFELFLGTNLYIGV